MNLEQVKNKQIPETRGSYTKRDTMLYGLGVGVCQDPLDPDQLRFVYEKDLQALPSMASVLAHPGFWIADPELEVDWVKLVHAEQYVELEKPLPPEGEVTARFRINGITDKGAEKGALLYFEKLLYAEDEAYLGKVVCTYFLRGDGGCGDWGEPNLELPKLPEGDPDGATEVPTLSIAALIYRLSGDYNPLHADPEVAHKAGFDRPILHGLCTYGIACQSLVRELCDWDASRLRNMGARFTKPVYPGETIRTEYWKGEGGDIKFRCLSQERGEVVLDRGTAKVV